MNIHFLHPEIFLLAPVLALILWKFLRARPFVAVLRGALLLLLLAILSEPSLAQRDAGRDLVFLVDRSKSMPADAAARIHEQIELAAERAERGDRIGIVAFGRRAEIEAIPAANFRFGGFGNPVDAGATDLAHAIETGLSLISRDRPGSLLLLTDGEPTGRDPMATAREAAAEGVRIDAVLFRREGVWDLAVEELSLPQEIGAGEPFQFSGWVRADRAQTSKYKLTRDGEVIAEGERPFRVGLNRLLFRDRVIDQGLHSYALEVIAAEDRVPENNRARAILKVAGPFRVLCVTPGGREDRLSRSIAQAGLETDVANPAELPIDLDTLEKYRAVVIENVAANELSTNALRSLALYVRHLGGGLLMTGGRASFGAGGYYRSDLADALPVSLEVRKEHRKFALAMAIALDRSGSMMAPVGGGQVKMDLANLGTCAAVELLSDIDSVSVIAVDSSAHIVIPATPVQDKPALMAEIRKIESQGGGIFVGEALHAAASELSRQPQANKHIVLFADAADSEEPGDYRTFVPGLVAAGVTISVIGLGTSTDSDAALLTEIATLGQGRCFFVSNPSELPRVFAEETLQVARSSWVDAETPVVVSPEIVAVGDLVKMNFPSIGGYSVAYLKPQAQLGLQTTDEQRAPIFSFWQHGLGRAAAFLGEVDGNATGPLGHWPQFGDYFSTVLRWLCGNEASGTYFAEIRRQGHTAVMSVQVERGREASLERLNAQVLDPKGQTLQLHLQRTGEQRVEATFELEDEGIYRPTLQVSESGFVRVSPLTLPYSPEFEPRPRSSSGEETLRQISTLTGGRLDPPADELFRGSRAGRGEQPLGALCAWLALACLLGEIAVRRLHVFFPAVAWQRLAGVLRLRRKKVVASPAKVEEAPTPASPSASEPAPTPPERRPEISDVIERAKARTKRKR